MDVTISGQSFPADIITWNISGTISEANDVGKVATLDTTHANTVKLGTDGTEIFGRIFHITDLSAQNGAKTCALETRGGLKVPTGDNTVAVGDKAVCGANGVIRAYAAATDTAIKFPLLWTVVEVDATAKTAVICKF